MTINNNKETGLAKREYDTGMRIWKCAVEILKITILIININNNKGVIPLFVPSNGVQQHQIGSFDPMNEATVFIFRAALKVHS